LQFGGAVIPPVSRSHPAARRSRRLLRHGTLSALGIVLIATLAPAAVSAADPKPAPDRGGIVAIIPEGKPAYGVAVDPVPSGAIGVQSSIGYQYGDNSVAVVGEVLNNASTRRRHVLIEVEWFDQNNQSLGTLKDYVVLDGVSRGSVGPFLLFDETPPANIVNYRIRAVSSLAITAPAVGALEILNSTSTIVGDVRRFQGTIHNPNTFAVTGVYAMATAYDAAGNVLDVTYDLPNGGALAAGASAPYVMDIVASTPGVAPYHHGRILADAFRSGSTTAYVTSWANYFDDLGTSNAFRSAIVWLAESGITSGCAAGRYCPDANVRRDQMATFLAQSLGLSGAAPNAFSDDNGNTHEASINRIALAGITNGCAPNLYCPTATVRRDQMASFLATALHLTGTAPNAFTDDNGNTHEGSINRLAAAGITDGCGGTKYCPSANVTRGQMAAFLRRAFE
jgi:hypothetical protein